MTFIVTILIILLAAAAVLIYMKQVKKQKEAQKARRRPGRGLVLSREPKTKSKSSMAAPFVLGAVILVLSSWVAASYLLPPPNEGKSPESTSSAKAQPEMEKATSKSISAKISFEQAEETGIGPQSSTEMSQMAQAAAEAAAQAGAAANSPTSLATPAKTAAADTGSAQSLSDINTNIITAANNTASEKAGANAEKSSAAPNANNNKTDNRREATKNNRGGGKTTASAAVNNSSSKTGGNTNKNTAQQQTLAGNKTKEPQAQISANRKTAGSSPVKTGPAPGNNKPALEPAADGREFTVHLGSFIDKNNAEQYKTKLTAAGETAFISTIKVNGQLWHRVRSGRFQDKNAANMHGLDLKRRGLVATDSGNFIVTPINQ